MKEDIETTREYVRGKCRKVDDRKGMKEENGGAKNHMGISKWENDVKTWSGKDKEWFSR